MTKRDELADAATDYVLEHGLIGLSLRPLAAEIGTSDRMLIYHFGTKDALVAAVLATSNDRSVATLRDLRPSAGPREAVLDLWAAGSTDQVLRCQRMYVEAAALGLFGREPYATSVTASNDAWMAALADHLAVSGVERGAAEDVASLVDATFNGLLLDQQLDDESVATGVVRRLADAVARDQGSA